MDYRSTHTNTIKGWRRYFLRARCHPRLRAEDFLCERFYLRHWCRLNQPLPPRRAVATPVLLCRGTMRTHGALL